MEPLWAATYLAAVLPFCVVAGWSDLRLMIIPNWVSLCILAVFFTLCLWVFPLSDIGFRLCVMLAVFVVGYLLNMFGLMGGGDAKLITVMTPFVAAGNWFNFVFYIALWSLATYAIHRIVMHSPLKDRYFKGWVSFENKRKFPYGLPLALGFISYLWMLAVPFS